MLGASVHPWRDGFGCFGVAWGILAVLWLVWRVRGSSSSLLPRLHECTSWKERRQWLNYQLLGQPCSTRIVATYFKWRECDGRISRQVLEDAELQSQRLIADSAAVLPSDIEMEVRTAHVLTSTHSNGERRAESSSPPPSSPPSSSASSSSFLRSLISIPPLPFQLSTLSDAFCFLCLSLILFVDRWSSSTLDARSIGDEQGTIDVTWGQLFYRYSSSSSSLHYRCLPPSSPLLNALPASTCALISATGFICYGLGLMVWLLVVLRIGADMKVAWQDVWEEERTSRRRGDPAFMGSAGHEPQDDEVEDAANGNPARRRKGRLSFCFPCCFLDLCLNAQSLLIRPYLRLRFIRFYLLLACIAPLAVLRLLTLIEAMQPSDATLSSSTTTPSFSLILLCFILLPIELTALIWETRHIESLTFKIDEEDERRFGFQRGREALPSLRLSAGNDEDNGQQSSASHDPLARQQRLEQSRQMLIEAQLADPISAAQPQAQHPSAHTPSAALQPDDSYGDEDWTYDPDDDDEWNGGPMRLRVARVDQFVTLTGEEVGAGAGEDSEQATKNDHAPSNNADEKSKGQETTATSSIDASSSSSSSSPAASSWQNSDGFADVIVPTSSYTAPTSFASQPVATVAQPSRHPSRHPSHQPN